jgi:energy-coupling factor transport system substrate-specific component
MRETFFHRDMFKVNAKDIALIGVMVAVIEVCKVVMMGIPNVELTTFWIILFALYFGAKVIYVVPVFILIEGLLFGFGLWWVMFLYVWPLLAIITLVMKKMDSAFGWGVLAGLFGLLYGAFCSIPYFFIGLVDGGVLGGIRSAFGWWIAGIPFDLIHGGSNFLIMLLLYKPVRAVMEKTKGLWVN